MYGEVLPVNYLSWTCVQLTVKLLSVRWGTELEVTTEIAVCSHLILPVLMSSYAVRHYKVEGVVSMLSCLCVHVGVYCDNGATTGSLWLSDRLSNEPRSVLGCSMPDLLRSCRSQSLGARLKTSGLQAVWHWLANLPVQYSSCATLYGQLLAFGGCDDSFRNFSTAIHQYNPATDTWEVISHMPTARSFSLVAVLPGNKLMVVEGYTDHTDKVEIQG